MYMGGVQGSSLLAVGEREPKCSIVSSCRCTVRHACLNTDRDVLLEKNMPFSAYCFFTSWVVLVDDLKVVDLPFLA